MSRFDGIIFDMDGTLIEPLLDFGAIRRDLGIDAETGILEGVAAMPPARAARARRRLLRHETTAARRAGLMPGAAETLAAFRRAGVPTALLTRNAAPAMRTILRRFPVLRFDLCWSRENGPIKPEPDGILRACRRLGVEPGRTACVGDFLFDVLAAEAAGAVSVLFAPGGPPDWADRADHVVAALSELPALAGL